MNHPYLNIAIEAARQASKIILRYADQLDRIDINRKSDKDLVTQVDCLAEDTIRQIIRKKYPNHSILAEEAGYTPGDEVCWIVDPLDGTANFVHGFPHYAISIAAQRNDQLEMGVVYDPVRDELFTALRGHGAQLNQRRIRVSTIKKLDDALIGTGFPFREAHHFKPYLNLFSSIFPKTAGVRRAGAAALDLAYVACGRFDGFWEAALKRWDMAAGVLLIKEAGGMVSDFQGENRYFDHGNVIAGNPKIFKQLLDLIHQSLHD